MSAHPTMATPPTAPVADQQTARAATCCGGAPQADTSACCALDEAQRAAGNAGCGCDAGACCAGGNKNAAASRCTPR